MNKIEIYTKYYCPYCTRAKSLLDSMGLDYIEYPVAFDAAKEREMIARSYRTTVPQIFLNGQSIGGSDDLVELVDSGVFMTLLEDHVSRTQSKQKELQYAA